MTDDGAAQPVPADRVRQRMDPRDLNGLTTRQVGGFVIVAGLVLAFARWLRRPRGKV